MTVSLLINGTVTDVSAPPVERLSSVLRDRLGLIGTKVGCDAGDCGACTVLLDGEPVNSCTVPVGRLGGHQVETVEGLVASGEVERLERSFLHHGGAQCGICTPGMLVAAAALLRSNPHPDEQAVLDGLGGVLCRCTGYRKIVEAVVAAPHFDEPTMDPPLGKAVGRSIPRLDGVPKVRGSEIFGADAAPEGALVIRLVRSLHHRARFTFGDLDRYVADHPGVAAVLTAADVPGRNRFGVIPPMADQPVLAEGETRFLGEAVAMVVGEASTMAALSLESFPITWEELPPLLDPDAALHPAAAAVHDHRPDNVLVRGLVERGDLEAAMADGHTVLEGRYQTSFVEHAYIEPEAGWAIRRGERLDVGVTTQSPHMDRAEVAAILGIGDDQVRIRPTAVGGGFGSKLDLSVQPFVAVAAWVLDRPVRITYSRIESMASTTKRHPATMDLRVAADPEGRLLALDFEGVFDTGAYASWGPTVANRVPVHAGGPYVYRAYRARTTAVHTHQPPSGAFRGFGVPQSTIAIESLLDELADEVGIDRLELRLRNALTAGTPTVTGQVFEAGVGYVDCLEALRPHYERARQEAAAAERSGPLRRGVGLAGGWYGCGNTALPNPSTVDVGLTAAGRIVLHQGAVDIGQGANTVITQICADALGAPLSVIDRIGPDTDLTPDAGKTSASRQTYVTGNAAFLAGQALREKVMALCGVGPDVDFEFGDGKVVAHHHGERSVLDLATMPADERGYVVSARASYDPPTSPLDEQGQGEPYAVFGYGAHLVELVVDVELGTVKLLRVTAAHDVGRAINPALVEGQVEGGVAQGIGMALMEEYLPGRSENLHDYLIPTFGDVPEIVHILVESQDPLGPYGAKGIGEHSLIPTAPAILNAIRDATGVSVRTVPATPGRVLAALAAS